LNRCVIFLLLACCAALLADPAPQPESIVENYCSARAGQDQALDGSSMEVEISASLPKLKKQGRLHALRHISRLGRITYEKLTLEGDSTVQKQVIARYLSSEAEAQSQPDPALAVTPANYKFKFAGEGDLRGRHTYVFMVEPRKKRAGMFQGAVWIDAATYLRVKESGFLVKNPSIFLKKVAFTREYEIRDGISVPRQVASIVDTRIWGQAHLEIDFSNFSVDEAQITAQAAANGQ
jgi:hypothetical protein